MSTPFNRFVLGAYGLKAGKYLLENLPQAGSDEERARIIAEASTLDTRVWELDEEKSRVATPSPITKPITKN